eukprot:TRINITY_DN669_c1_g1_i1.p1 TRINITY_DN669_c1_g1~~TRINITY_DN669_c1_g1_i1.p1  ORF type:complete len:481 (-),score=84.41 TRINITY_DN669_c1_g1_i1:48-1490(-)
MQAQQPPSVAKRVGQIVLGIFAVLALLHIGIELVVYRGSNQAPLHDRVLRGDLLSGGGSGAGGVVGGGRVVMTGENAPGALIRQNSDRFISGPGDLAEEQRHQHKAGDSGFFAYRDTRKEWETPATQFHWCSAHASYHKGAFSNDECFEWMTYRYMGPGQGTFHQDRRRGARSDALSTKRNLTHRIALVIPWTGKSLPKWQAYFLSSIAANADIADWLFIVQEGNFDVPKDLPANVKLLWVRSFEQFFTARLGMPFYLGTDTRKFADVKPTYGAALEPELRGYTHWAFTDADMIYGKFSRMLAPWELDFYDVMSCMGEDASHMYNAGPLTIFKNNELSRTYWRAPDFHSSKPHTHVSHEGGQWAFDERLSSQVLWNMDNVRVLYNVGRLFNDLCSTPSDYKYTWRNGMLKRTLLARDGRKVPAKNAVVEEGIGIHFAMSKMMVQPGEMIVDARSAVDSTTPFDMTLVPNFHFSSAASGSD